MAGRGRVTNRSVRFILLALVAATFGFVALAVSLSKSGDAAFPGANGRIAYSAGDAYTTAVWTSNADGSSPSMLTPGSGYFAPAYSANGARIAVEHEGGISTVNSDGSGLAQIAPGSESISSEPAEWKEDYDDPYSAKVIPVVRISTYVEVWKAFFGPAFTPDGSQLAATESNGRFTRKSICAVESVGDEECIGYEEPGSFFDYEFDCTGCATHLVTLNSASGAKTGDLTPPTPSQDDYDPTYSADGKLAYTHASPGAEGRTIFATASPGGPSVKVASNGAEPDFSPDGSRIVFVHEFKDLALVGAGGGAVTLLPVPLAPGAAHSEVGSPVFSPDGTRIAFQRTAYDSSWKRIESGVFTIGVDGSSLTKVADRASGPSWQPLAPPLPPPPPVVKARAKGVKGKVALNRKHMAAIGTIVCGSSTCTLKSLGSTLKVGKSKFPGKVKLARKVAAGKKVIVKALIVGKGLRALGKAGKGAFQTKIQVTDVSGKETLTLKATLLPAKKKPRKAKR